jgi:hypothetical protein
MARKIHDGTTTNPTFTLDEFFDDTGHEAVAARTINQRRSGPMTTQQPKLFQVSIRGETRDKLRAYCRKHGVQMRTVIDDLIMRSIAAEEKAGS